MNLRSAFILFGIFLWSCAIQAPVSQTPPLAGTSPVFVDPSINTESGIDPVNIKSAQQVGEYVVLDVSYSGGCEEHEFQLVSKGQYTSTYPPEVEITLKHDDKGDRCRGIIDKKLWYDLTELKYEGTNRIFLVLTNTNMILEYNY